MRFLLLFATALSCFGQATLNRATINNAGLASYGVYITGFTIETNGWVAQVYMSGPGLSTNGAYAYGLGTSNTFSGQESLVVGLTSPGFDDAGVAQNIARRVVGTKRLRWPYPNQANAYEYLNGVQVVTRIALSDYVHTNDIVTNVVITEQFYTQGGTRSNARTNFTTITNLSWVVPPRCLAMWSQPDWFLSGGSNYQVSLVAFQYSGQQKRPVRAVKFWSVDAAGNSSPSTFVLNPTIDVNQTDAVPVIEFTNNIDCSTMVQGSVISNYAIVYPWWGPKLDLSDNVNVPGSADYCPSVTYCDKSNVWAKVFAIVDPVNGVDATGWARTNQAAALDPTNKAFLTIARALDACAGTNNTFNNSNTLSNCTVYLTNGNYDVFGGNFANYNANPLTWTTIAGRPDVNWSNVFLVTANNTLTGQSDLKFRTFHLVCKVVAFANTFGQGYGNVLIDNCIVQTNTSGASLISSTTNAWLRQSLFSGMRIFPNPSANQAKSWTKSRGCTFTSFDFVLDGRSTPINTVLFIGNSIIPNLGREQYGLVNDSPVVFDPVIWAFNKLMNSDGATVTAAIGLNASVVKGAAFIQNLVEGTGTSGAGLGLDVMESDVNNEWCTNFLIWNDTIISKYHPPFNLSGRTTVSADHYMDSGNIFASREIILDVLNSNGNATNRWSLLYSVGDVNNASTQIGLTGGATIGNNPAGQELGFDGIPSYYDVTTNSITFKFLTNNSCWGGNSNGLGDYHLTAASPLINTWLTGTVFLPFDIEGVARAGNNPPGAYVTPK